MDLTLKLEGRAKKNMPRILIKFAEMLNLELKPHYMKFWAPTSKRDGAWGLIVVIKKKNTFFENCIFEIR